MKLTLPYSPIPEHITLIGIHGKAGSGKDTIANELSNTWLNHVKAFADPVRDLTATMFRIDRGLFIDRASKETIIPDLGYSPRELLQYVGTELVRDNVDEQFWIKHMSWRIAASHSSTIIIPDVRFQNEVDWVLSHPKSYLISVHRPGISEVGIKNHASEAGIKIPEEYVHKTYDIQNTGTLEDLYKKVQDFTDHISAI